MSTEVTMHIPGASDSLARVGYCLGRACETDDPYETLATFYDQMTHAWLCLQEFSDDAIKQLYKDGGRAYAGSKGERETQFDKDIAFSEAAAATPRTEYPGGAQLFRAWQGRAKIPRRYASGSCRRSKRSTTLLAWTMG